MRVEGGNLIGTEAYFPFYKTEIRNIRYLDGPGEESAPGKTPRTAEVKHSVHQA